jgi:FKBP-type peptidyl-prolyl cis-trans isomerase
MKNHLPFVLKVYLVVSTAFLFSCTQSPPEEQKNNIQSSANLKKQLERVNKIQTYSEASQIEDYLSRYHYPVDTTPTGLRYYIYKKNEGMQPVKNSIVEISYKVMLLDGTVCYSSDSTGNLEFQLNKTDLPVGLQEGLLLMKTGEKAIFIAPSKLGYGLTGDGANIPPNAVLSYNVELLKIIKNKK